MKYILILLTLMSTSVLSADIAYGTLKGIKVYDYSSSKYTALYFSDNATNKNVEGCNGVAKITHSLRSEASLNQIMSIAMAAYVSGKKVRANSSGNTCELDFLAIQESVF